MNQSKIEKKSSKDKQKFMNKNRMTILIYSIILSKKKKFSYKIKNNSIKIYIKIILVLTNNCRYKNKIQKVINLFIIKLLRKVKLKI